MIDDVDLAYELDQAYDRGYDEGFADGKAVGFADGWDAAVAASEEGGRVG